MADDPNLSGAAQPDQDATSEESAEELRAKAIKFVFLSALEQLANLPDPFGTELTVIHHEATDEPAGIRIRATVRDDFGAFSCEYEPQAAVGKMFSLIEKEIAEMTAVVFSSEGSEVVRLIGNYLPPEQAPEITKKFTEFAVIFLVQILSGSIARAIRASFDQAHEFAVAGFQSIVVSQIAESPNTLNTTLNATPEIEKYVREATENAREQWTLLFGAIPGVRSRRIKGRPKEWTTAKLKSAVKKAAKAARPTLKPGDHLTLEHVTIELNKNRNDQKPLTVNAVKKLLGRYEVDWMGIRDAINSKAFWHFPKNK
jgi:hypothetical protein